ncbi:DUF4251 domain-containing protein [Leeuwenhoekiella parthenopeia]|uniref:DUF4251 domain-containing protein n=1 Tax=Leeuwenhoekiella parthenopeia TaxID=2890320 RepID=A0ABS8GRU3_9FLAO|nr:DUF4251 domain-containing protein [Leeuwenhoekiella parthenopeia]MCC4212704.1 DUF4251 domain-containing protein [Leeuwenhoekiella parthenopeia]
MKTLVFTMLTLVLISCGSASQADATSNPELNNWVNNRNFTVESNFAMPMATTAVNAVLNTGILGPGNTGAQISLIGNSNHLTIKGDSISANLPFFGERRMGGGYGTRDNGITIDGLMKNYSVETKRGMYIIRFSANDTQGNEAYDFVVNLSPGLSANMSVNSTQRTNMQYRGTVEAVQEPEANL